MNDIVVYFVQSGINLAILFVIYWLFLRRDTFYRANRYYLLISVVVSFLFPLMKTSLPGSGQAGYLYILEPIVITPQLVADRMHHHLSLSAFLTGIYLAGVAFFLVRFSYQFFQIMWLVKRYGVEPYKGLKLVVMDDQDYVPFSVFDMVFIQRSMLGKPELQKILAHEKAHIQEHHTIDLLILELCLIIQWFNPFIWLTRKSLKSIHEYLADASVLSKGIKVSEYQQLLLDQTLGIQCVIFSNNLNQSLTKKRFIMMSKNRTHGWNRIKLVLFLPAAIAISIALTVNFTDNVVAQTRHQAFSNVLQPMDASVAVINAPQEEPVYTVVEEMPKYPGGQDAMIKYMINNIKYPENARKNGIQGTVFVTFLIEKSGKVTNVKVLRGVDEELDKEALRVVSEMPAWNPGKEKGKPVNVQFNLPVAFKLDSGDEKEEVKPENPKRFQEVKKIDK